MSPNEFQLRAALHDGEGDPVSADRVIAGAQRMRRDRRRRITSIASGAIVVAVIGVGVTALARSGSSESGGGSENGAALRYPNAHAPNHELSAPPRTSETSTGAAEAPAASAHGSAAQVLCPARFPQLMLPGGGGTGQFGAGEPLFAEPVASITICVYGVSGDAAGSDVVTGSAARDLAATLENGAKSATGTSCADIPSGDLAFYAITPGGKRLRFVTAHLACPFRVTNGTAVRYVQPDQLGRFGLPQDGAANTSPPRNDGSPLH